MTALTNWPTITLGFAFGTNPGTWPITYTATPSTGVGSADNFNITTGRQYELGQTQSATLNAMLENLDWRYAPPGPVGTLYAGNVRLFVPVQISVVWSAVTYYLFTGFVQRWPMQLGSGTAGQFTWSPMIASDLLTSLSLIGLSYVLQEEILADAPLGYWPLDDSQTATQAGNLAPGTVGSMTETTLGAGGQVMFGGNAPTQLAGGSASVVTFTPGSATDATVLESAQVFTDSGYDSGPTYAIWFRCVFSGAEQSLTSIRYGTSLSGDRRIYIDSSGVLQSPVGSSGVFVADNQWHQLIVSTTGTSITIGVDGVFGGTLVLGTGFPHTTYCSLIVGGCPGAGIVGFTGQIADVAGWQQDIGPSTGRFAVQYEAGATAFAGDLSGARFGRILDYAGIPSSARNLAAGVSTLSGATTISGQTALQGLQDVTAWESGGMFVDGSGRVTFSQRTDHYNQASTATFGENAGESHYQDDITFDYDPTYLFNEVTITRNGGISAFDSDAVSIGEYFVHSANLTTGIASDNETVDAASYFVDRYAQPQWRVSNMTLIPSADTTGALWPICLGLTQGQTVTVNRRVGGVLGPMSGIYVVDKITHNVVTGPPSTWTTKIQLSPADVNFYWKLQDSTYGVLDSTTRLAY